MGQKVRKSLCHFPAPLQGLLGFGDLSPGLIALGYIPVLTEDMVNRSLLSG